MNMNRYCFNIKDGVTVVSMQGHWHLFTSSLYIKVYILKYASVFIVWFQWIPGVEREMVEMLDTWYIYEDPLV